DAASTPSRQRRAAVAMHHARARPMAIAPGTPHSTIAWMYSFSRCENVMYALGAWTRVNEGSSAPRPIPTHGVSCTRSNDDRHAAYLDSGWLSSTSEVFSSWSATRPALVYTASARPKAITIVIGTSLISGRFCRA